MSLRRKQHNNKSHDQGRGLPVSWPLPSQPWAAQASAGSGQSYPKSVQGFGPLTQVLPEAQRSRI